MRVLLDECVPKRLWRSLGGHAIGTVTQMGWSGKKNVVLIAAMLADGFEVLLTVDQNLRHQQNLSAAGISLIILIAVSNRIQDLLSLVPSTLRALTTIQPGQIVEIAS